MELLFEKSVPGCGSTLLPPCDTEPYTLPAALLRRDAPALPELGESELIRHYSALERRCFGVGDGFYPLGSCTMKYNPKINEDIAALPGFTGIHPFQPDDHVQGCLAVLREAGTLLCDVTGMDAMSFQPAAGAHGELTGLLLIKKYHELRGDTTRSKILIPDSAHGTNPATATMAGNRVVQLPSAADGCVDLAALAAAAGDDTAGLMLTNPNTLGLFERDILKITEIVHRAGGLVYYDGANLNAIMGVVRPGDMGFDCVHLNLHKTFATPHGGGGPGSGAVGCKDFLAPYLPRPVVVERDGSLMLDEDRPESIGRVKAFHGNFLVVLRALAYLKSLGAAGLRDAAQNAVLNANYLMRRLAERYEIVGVEGESPDRPFICMHEFVLTLRREAKELGVTARDIAKALIDEGMHPPTMYFPLIIPEALMVEPTETESRETLDRAAEAFLRLHEKARTEPETLRSAPHGTVISRPDEVAAARTPKLRFGG